MNSDRKPFVEDPSTIILYDYMNNLSYAISSLAAATMSTESGPYCTSWEASWDSLPELPDAMQLALCPLVPGFQAPLLRQVSLLSPASFLSRLSPSFCPHLPNPTASCSSPRPHSGCRADYKGGRTEGKLRICC